MVAVEIDYAVQSTSGDEPMFAHSEFRSQLHDLPPSAKLVAKVLDHHAPLNKAQLSEKTLLPERTTRYAVKQLEDTGLVTSRVDPRDARKCIYELQYPG